MINRALMGHSKIRMIVENLNIFIACVQLLIIPIAMIINVGLVLELFGVGDHTTALIWSLSAALVIYVGWRGGVLPVLPDPRKQVFYSIGHWFIFIGLSCRLLSLWLMNQNFHVRLLIEAANSVSHITHIVGFPSIGIGVFLIGMSRWTEDAATLKKAQEKIQYQSIELLSSFHSVLKSMQRVLKGMLTGLFVGIIISCALLIVEFLSGQDNSGLYGVMILILYFLLFIPAFVLGVDALYLEEQLPHLVYAMPWAALAGEDFSSVIAFCIGITINACIAGGCIAFAKQLYRSTPDFQGWIFVKGMRNGAIVGFLATAWMTVECGYLSLFCGGLKLIFLVPSGLLGIDSFHGPQPHLIYGLPWSVIAQRSLSPASAFCMGVTINAAIAGACLAWMKASRKRPKSAKISPK